MHQLCCECSEEYADSGCFVCSFVPEHLVRRLNVAGRHITKYFIKLLLARGYAFNRTADFQVRGGPFLCVSVHS